MSNNFITTVNEEGQIAIPEILRRRLNIKPGDKVELRVNDEILTAKRLLSLEETFGSVPPLDPPKPWKQIREEKHNEYARRDKQKNQMYQDLEDLKSLKVKAGSDASITIDDTLYGESNR